MTMTGNSEETIKDAPPATLIWLNLYSIQAQTAKRTFISYGGELCSTLLFPTLMTT